VKALFKLAYYDLQNGHTDLDLAKPEFVNKKGICKQKGAKLWNSLPLVGKQAQSIY
jgi:hypothetical protein